MVPIRMVQGFVDNRKRWRRMIILWAIGAHGVEYTMAIPSGRNRLDNLASSVDRRDQERVQYIAVTAVLTPY